MNTEAPVVLSNEDFAIELARPLTKVYLLLLFYLIAAIVIGFRDGWEGLPQYLITAVIVSIIGLWAFYQLVYKEAENVPLSEHPLRTLQALGAAPPFLLGCYLVFLEGILGLWRTVHVFSIASLVWAGLSILLGYKIVYYTWLLTEFAMSVKTKRLQRLPRDPDR